MTILASSAARFLIQAVAAHDTVIMRQVPPVRTWFEQLVFVASGISTLLVLVLVTGLVSALLAVRRSVQRAHEALDKRIADFGKRVDDFNELLGRVQRRAETVVHVGEKAMDGIAAWGGAKIGEKLGEKVGESIDERFGASSRRRRRRGRGGRGGQQNEPQNQRPNQQSQQNQQSKQAEPPRESRPSVTQADDDDGDSPYDDARETRR